MCYTEEPIKKIVRVVGAAIVRDGRILVAQRAMSDIPYKSLKWEFPGGKIETGESEEEAIVREIQEELGCEIEVDALIPEMEHEYPDFILRMTICICHLCAGEIPHCLEHNELRWVTPSDLPSLDWAAADARCYPNVTSYLESTNFLFCREGEIS